MSGMTRRQMLVAITQIATVTTLVSCGEDAADNSEMDSVSARVSDLEILASVSYDLFPHESLTPALYIKVANSILSLDDPLVSAGLAQLLTVSNGQSWLDISDVERTDILRAIQDSEFFALIRSSTIAILYSEPAFFDLVGYGGSAVEFGGYLDRGFDDISWLPASESVQ